MKIGVYLNFIPDPELTLNVTSSGLKEPSEPSQYIMNPFDEYALEAALKIKDYQPCEIILLSICKPVLSQLIKEALATGADSSVLIEDNQEGPVINNLQRAFILKRLVEKYQLDYIFMGKDQVFSGNSEIGPALSVYLGWKLFYNVKSIHLLEDSLESDLGRYAVKVNPLSVICFGRGVDSIRLPTFQNILQVESMPVVKESTEGLLNKRSFTVDHIEYVDRSRKGIRIINSIREITCSQLISFLKESNFQFDKKILDNEPIK